ncbi:MAG: caspase family protein, partial [Proteobacteria bacterium]|nr:caspase family protein [Pseudomonadota bacterium]
SLLTKNYGYKVQVLTNGDDASVLKALNKLNETLSAEDNLLIYYSGHGNRRKTGNYETGYWLPVNAEPPPNDTYWVPTEQISGHLARIKAKRIIVIADSSFAGLLANNPAFLLASSRASLQSEAYISLRMPNKSRLLLTSGRDHPMADDGGHSTSIFATAFIEVLEKNDRVLTAPALFLAILDQLGEEQTAVAPEFKAIKRAGDEVGDFFFVAR